MATRYGFPLLEDPVELARYQGWSNVVHDDLLALEDGKMSEAEFDERYRATKSILVLDVTGFTVSTLRGGARSRSIAGSGCSTNQPTSVTIRRSVVSGSDAVRSMRSGRTGRWGTR